MKNKIKSKTNKNWKRTWNNIIVWGAKILCTILGHKKSK